MNSSLETYLEVLGTLKDLQNRDSNLAVLAPLDQDQYGMSNNPCASTDTNVARSPSTPSGGSPNDRYGPYRSSSKVMEADCGLSRGQKSTSEAYRPDRQQHWCQETPENSLMGMAKEALRLLPDDPVQSVLPLKRNKQSHDAQKQTAKATASSAYRARCGKLSFDEVLISNVKKARLRQALSLFNTEMNETRTALKIMAAEGSEWPNSVADKRVIGLRDKSGNNTVTMGSYNEDGYLGDIVLADGVSKVR
ncbi:MAG: hypothetical protein Q9170_007227 [Blastenia crenularia]